MRRWICAAASAAYVLAWTAVAARQVGSQPPPVPPSAPVQMFLALAVATGLGFLAGLTYRRSARA